MEHEADDNMTSETNRILIVDDDRISIQAIAASLRDDYTVMAATGYDQAMKAVHAPKGPDLILLDVMIPEVDGFEICRRLKADPLSKDIPVIFLTARDKDRDEAKGLELGAVDYINKPVIPAIVRARVQTHIDLHRHVNALEQAYATIEMQRDRMEEELQVAQQLQQSLLPDFSDTNEEVTVHAAMEPAREMSGDFYDVFYADRDHLCLCIGDVMGKGVPAALFMGISKALVRAKAEYSLSTAHIVSGVNAEIMKNNDACMFVTLFVAIIEIKTGHVVYTNAGHNPPWMKCSDGSLGKIKGHHGPPVGTGEREYGETMLSLSKDDLLLLYTDGVTEARNAGGDLFGEANFVHLLESGTAPSPEAIIQSTLDTVEAFVHEAPRADDLTLIALKYNIVPDRKPNRRYETVLSEQDLQSGTLNESIRQFLEIVDIEETHESVFQLVMDELISNILKYGFPDGGSPYIAIVLEHAVDHLRLHLTDNGISFNPTSAPTPDVTVPLARRKAGGLGIHLCRSLMDEMYYERKHLRNHLTVVKRLEYDPDDLRLMQEARAHQAPPL